MCRRRRRMTNSANVIEAQPSAISARAVQETCVIAQVETRVSVKSNAWTKARMPARARVHARYLVCAPSFVCASERARSCVRACACPPMSANVCECPPMSKRYVGGMRARVCVHAPAACMRVLRA
eukprot:3126561-Pleurochrysis_carterae.AAC.1